MSSQNTTQRKNFRCIFNPYVTKENQDGVVRSIISQFEGYYAEPEVTITDDGFIISLTVGENLNPTTVRDKILWNSFVESVTAQDAIRKIQILRLPKASLMDFGARNPNEGTVGGFGPQAGPNGQSGVTEIMFENGEPIPHEEYKMDMGERPDGQPFKRSKGSVHYADPTGNLLPTTWGPGSDTGEPVDEDLVSDITNMDDQTTTALDGGTKEHRQVPKVFNASFKMLSFDSDTGGSFTLNQPNGFQSVEDPPDQGPLHERANPGTGIGGGAPISGASWYVTQPGNEQGTQLGVERNKDYDTDTSSAPFAGITPHGSKKAEPPKEGDEGIIGHYGDELEVLGVVDSDPLGGASYGSRTPIDIGWYFGVTETYDYEGDVDDYNL